MLMENNSGSGQGHAIFDEIADWLIDQALGNFNLETLGKQFFDRLYAVGIPISRGHIAFNTLHPLFAAVSMNWERGKGIEANYHPHITAQDSDEWQNSPFFTMLENDMSLLRRRLSGDDALLDFPILNELRDSGGTDYLAYVVTFGDTREDGGIIGSWLTDRPAGFRDDEIKLLLRLQKRLALAYKIGIKEQISQNIVTAYLGHSAGKKVMSGGIKRGDGEDIYAVIWFSDLRDSIKLANELPRGEFLELLNDFLECMAGAVQDNGGEILRYVGDSALAIFTIEGDLSKENDGNKPCQKSACEKALAATRDAANRIDALNEQRRKNAEPDLDYGIGLHIGNVMYGNIGSPERIEFTVVGPAANLAARIESQCKVQKEKLLISSKFAKCFPTQLQSTGYHKLAGFDEKQELFTLN